MEREKKSPEEKIGSVEEPLGMNERQYHELLASLPGIKILPTEKKQERRIQMLLKEIKTGEIDEDVKLICSWITGRMGREKTTMREGSSRSTPYGQLEKEVDKELKELSKEGHTRRGRKPIKKKIILYLIHDYAWWKYPRIARGIINSFTAKENEEIRQGTIHVLKEQEEDIHPFLYDERIFDFYNLEKWKKSFRDNIKPTTSLQTQISGDIDAGAERIFREAAFGGYGIPWKFEDISRKLALYENEVKGEQTQVEKERRMKGIGVLSYIYAVRNVEEMLGVKFFKSNKILIKTWDIPRRTFYKKQKYLREIDQRYSDVMKPRDEWRGDTG